MKSPCPYSGCLTLFAWFSSSSIITAPSMDFPPDESRGYIINIIAWVGAALATCFVALRICSRVFILRSPGWDDFIIVIAALLNIVTMSLSTVAVSHGLGRHVYYLSQEQIMHTLYYSTILQPIGIAAYCLPKLAVVILIISLMGTTKRGVFALHSVIAIFFITSALSAIMIFAQCNPPNHLWHPWEPAKCLPSYVLKNVSYVGGCKSFLLPLQMHLN